VTLQKAHGRATAAKRSTVAVFLLQLFERDVALLARKQIFLACRQHTRIKELENILKSLLACPPSAVK
jgi:hypothetical protein